MEENSGAAEDATAERICCPNDKSGSWLAPSSLDLASISLTHFWRFNSCAISPIRQGIQVGNYVGAAETGHQLLRCTCPLSGAKRTFLLLTKADMPPNEPMRQFV